MNPSHTNRLRPRDRVSPRSSPLSSPTLNRRSGSLPVATTGDRPTVNIRNVSPDSASGRITTWKGNPQIDKSGTLSTVIKVGPISLYMPRKWHSFGILFEWALVLSLLFTHDR